METLSGNKEKTQQSPPVDKIDVEELIKGFKVVSIKCFSAYLKEVWKVKLQ
jgi:hypothetical protein